MDIGFDSPVAVIASTDTDQAFLCAMVNKAGFKAVTYRSSDEFDEKGVTPHASVLCIRQTVGESGTKNIGVPRNLRTRRVLVCSDSSTEEVIVSALESGAHYYFNIEESPRVLQARLTAALRLHNTPVKQDLIIDPYHFNVERRVVRLNDSVVNLSPKEYEFAHYIFANRNRIVSNSELMTSVWSLPPSMDARRIDTAACRVRKKMQLDERTGWWLRRLRCVGYELHFSENAAQPESDPQIATRKPSVGSGRLNRVTQQGEVVGITTKLNNDTSTNRAALAKA